MGRQQRVLTISDKFVRGCKRFEKKSSEGSAAYAKDPFLWRVANTSDYLPEGIDYPLAENIRKNQLAFALDLSMYEQRDNLLQ
jgi:hypothetical protein